MILELLKVIEKKMYIVHSIDAGYMDYVIHALIHVTPCPCQHVEFTPQTASDVMIRQV